jgi:hypothetical protein
VAEASGAWSVEQVDDFAARVDPKEVLKVLLELAEHPDDQALGVLRTFLGASGASKASRDVPAQAAAMVLISLGEPGVAVLRDALVSVQRENGRWPVRQKTAVMGALYLASRGKLMPWPGHLTRVKQLDALPVSTEARVAAEQAIRDVIAECLVKPALFATVAEFIHRGWVLTTERALGVEAGEQAAAEFGRDVIELVAESSIRLSRSVIEEYRILLEAAEREESYQRFLADHPVFLDPLSDEVVVKQRLGIDFATDFAVRRLDGRWVLVEIEKPQDRIFTQAYDFTAEFTHAFGQVLDFQHWVDDNVAYAQKTMCGITAPRGLLVIGTRSGLDSRARAKLARFADNSGRVDVVTFDDLLAGAENLYATLHRTRDQLGEG